MVVSMHYHISYFILLHGFKELLLLRTAVLWFAKISAILQLIVLDDLEVPTHKTKNIPNYVKHMESTKKVLLVDGGPINEKLKLSTQNLYYVNALPSIGLNFYSVPLHDTLVMLRDAVNRIVERMNTPINC